MGKSEVRVEYFHGRKRSRKVFLFELITCVCWYWCIMAVKSAEVLAEGKLKELAMEAMAFWAAMAAVDREIWGKGSGNEICKSLFVNSDHYLFNTVHFGRNHCCFAVVRFAAGILANSIRAFGHNLAFWLLDIGTTVQTTRAHLGLPSWSILVVRVLLPGKLKINPSIDKKTEKTSIQGILKSTFGLNLNPLKLGIREFVSIVLAESLIAHIY